MLERNESSLSATLLYLVQGELVDRGGLGEVLTKYMFTRAFDEANAAERYIASVTLGSFFQSLGLDINKVTVQAQRRHLSRHKIG